MEPEIVRTVDPGCIVPLHPGVQPFRTDQAGVVTLARDASGDCHFHGDARCRLQLAGGERLLPSACRHFPRVLLLDSRGCLLTLSHYCPTAAQLLVTGGAIRIVRAAPPLELTGEVEGLDARDALPPLLRPGMLMDVNDYGHFETRCLQVLSDTGDGERGLEVIAAAVEDIRQWQPGSTPLGERIDRGFEAALNLAAGVRRQAGWSDGFRMALELTGPHPSMSIPDRFESRWRQARTAGAGRLGGLMARYLSAAVFGNWIAYRGQGLRSIVEWLRACQDVLRLQIVRVMGESPTLSESDMIEAVRAADYLLVHTVDSLAFGRAAVTCEHRTTHA